MGAIGSGGLLPLIILFLLFSHLGKDGKKFRA